MKTTYHSHLRGTNGCLGFYYGLDALLSDFPEGGLPGEFFVNGETQSMWIWDEKSRTWKDSNHVSPVPFMGLIDDPETFSVSLAQNVKGCFIYIVGQPGTYKFPRLSGSEAISVEADSAGIITLVWDGEMWRREFTPIVIGSANAAVQLPLYRGEWYPSQIYRCSDGFFDVVSVLGTYYRLKSGVKEAQLNVSPHVSDEWELFPRYAAIANELRLLPNSLLELYDGQGIGNFSSDYMGYIISNGEIFNIATETRLDCEGRIRVPVQGGDGEIVISPDFNENGIRVYTGRNAANEVIRLGFDENFFPLLELKSVEGDVKYKFSIQPKAVTFSILPNGSSEETNLFQISPHGLNAVIKHQSDNLNPGDLYYDDDGIVHYCM